MPSRAHKVTLPILALCLLGSALVSCSPDPVTLAATHPLERIVISPVETLLYAESGVHLHELVSTEPFREKNLKPGMTAAEVAKILGEPDYLSEDREGRDGVFGFHAEMGDFEVVKQHVSSEGIEVDRWFLRYRPRDCTSLLDPRVLRQVQNLEPFPRRVTVFSGSGRRGTAILEFDEERTCSAVWWLQQDGV
jgi:hypothetical protein